MFQCPACHNASLDPGDFTCPACKTSFPHIEERIPVLIPDADFFLAGLYYQYMHFDHECKEQIRRLAEEIKQYPKTRSQLEKWKTAFVANAAIIRQLATELEDYFPKSALAQQAIRKPQQAYMTNFQYVRRDWTDSAAGKAETTLIRECLESYLSPWFGQIEQTLMLGAGTCRTAWDLADHLPNIYAVDRSYSLLTFFDRIRRGAFHFYEILRQNTRSIADQVRLHSARLPQAKAKFDRLHTVLAEVQNLPFPDQSMDLVLSIYFSDVLPIEKWLDEVKRVLKPGGLFLHFGPLEYHFTEFGPSLSLEEMRNCFESNQFRFLKEEMLRSTHLATEGVLTTRYYDNWVFLAEYKGKD